MPSSKCARRMIVLACIAPIAGLSSAALAQQSPPASQAGLGLTQDPALVLRDAGTSGAITMVPGETYLGPGPMTVGYLGAKKQIILPNGRWVLLAVADRQSGHPNQPVPLVSMVFGQFKEGRLVSLMSYLFNGRAVQGTRPWADFDGCQSGQQVPRGVTKVGDTERGAPGCAWTVRMTTLPKVEDAAWVRAFEAAQSLGAGVPVPPVQFTRAWVVDSRGTNYLGMRRADFDATADAAALQTARSAWLGEYLPLMIDGFDKRVGATELEPNQSRLPSVRVSLPD
jgi:hypothetical protein